MGAAHCDVGKKADVSPRPLSFWFLLNTRPCAIPEVGVIQGCQSVYSLALLFHGLNTSILLHVFRVSWPWVPNGNAS